MPRTYEDFVVEISPSDDHGHTLRVVRSSAGECTIPYAFPYDSGALQLRLKDLQIALLRSGGTRRAVLLPEESTVQEFGAALYDSIFTGEVRTLLEVSRHAATDAGHGLRLRMRIQSPQIAALPWEFLFDSRLGDFVALASDMPIVRHLPLTRTTEPLTITPPLRVLGMIASPANLPAIDVRTERATVERALRRLIERGLVELHWVEGQSWRDLRQRVRDEPWHVVHFMGHGSFDATAREGVIYFANDNGQADAFTATEFNRVLSGNQALRLVLLNACLGAGGDVQDIFSSTAATLVRGGVPAVIAMQYEITDAAATEFARTFYEALVDGLPVDAAVDEARRAISVSISNSLEWGIPVLFMRSPDGQIFTVDTAAARATPPTVPPAEPPSVQSQPQTPMPVPIPVPATDAPARAEATRARSHYLATEEDIPEQNAPVSTPMLSSTAAPMRARTLSKRTWWVAGALLAIALAATTWFVIDRIRRADFTSAANPQLAQTLETLEAVADSDGDGLPDVEERELNIDPFNNDWDGDGLLDGEEVNEYGTSPRDKDTDGDRLTDYEEIHVWRTGPLKRDSDGDGIDDFAKVQVFMTQTAEPLVTPAPAETPTPTQTSTPTPTLTTSITPAATRTLSIRILPSPTALLLTTLSIRPTSSPDPNVPLFPELVAQAAFAPSKHADPDLAIGMHVRIQNVPRLNVRDAAGIEDGKIVGYLENDERAIIIDGPQLLQGESDTIVWWQVESENGTIGWVPANSNFSPLLEHLD